MFDLGLTDEQFWETTPRELDALYKRWTAAEELHERRFALIRWDFANALRGEHKAVIPFRKFFRTAADRAANPDPKPVNPGVITPEFRAFQQDWDAMMLKRGHA